MSTKIGSVKAYHNNDVCIVANIYDTKQTTLSLAVRHNNTVGYIPLNPASVSTSAPHLTVQRGGTVYTSASLMNGQTWYLSRQAWYPLFSNRATYGWLAADSASKNEGCLEDGDSNVTVWITNVGSVLGDPQGSDAIDASASVVSDVTVTGSTDGLYIRIDGTEYGVDSNGKLKAVEIIAAAVVNRTKRASGKIVSRTLTHVNPNATDEQLKTFITSLNSLSDNQSVGAFRVSKKR